MNNDGCGILNEDIHLSDEDSNAASLGSRVSDDSGIEDWSDDMTIQTEQQGGNPSKEILDGSSGIPELLHNPISPIKEEVGLTECIYPTLPELHPINDFKGDVLADDGICGVSGLYNLGNTCFMNAALQCLFVTPALRKLVLEGDILQNGSDHMDEPANVLLFVERFQELFHKVLSGKYSVLYPDEFHMSIARLHQALGDYKQHDSQEFLSFLLNTLHDLLNRNSRHSRVHNAKAEHVLKSKESEDSSESIHGEVSKRLKMDNDVEICTPIEPDAGVECEENLSKAECSWREYTATNQSLIIDSFHGQFQSVIICEKCAFVSTIYEPFMSLSLPIPHAMEKQVVITWVPSLKNCALPGMMSVMKYCVTVNKSSCIGDVKNIFLAMVKKKDSHLNTNDIVLAEVNKSANVSILDDRTQISYLSKTKNVYAIEVLHENQTNQTNSYSVDSTKTFYDDDFLNNTDNIYNGNVLDKGANETNGHIFDSSTNNSIDNDTMSGVDNAAAWHSCGICLEEIFDEELKVHLVCGGLLCDTCLLSLVEVHKQQKLPCPICNRYISIDDYTLLVEPKMNGEVKKIRQILVPIMFRHDSSGSMAGCSRKFNLFGHPVICSLPSQVESSTVLEVTNQVLQNVSNMATTFDVIITDGAGLSCGLCDLFSSCTGCHVQHGEQLQLKPGSCLSVHFYGNVEMVVKTMKLFQEDSSMKEFRNTDTIMLNECLTKFGDTELLTKDNPWFCTQCQTNQMAVKNMTVTRWPDTLIIHLKRFYYEGNQGCKITCPVDFSLHDLNIDVLTCADGDTDASKIPVLYNLYSFICHNGTLLGGHYTALCKANPSSDWFFFNDESFGKMLPTEEHKKEGYVLFYQRQYSERGRIDE